MTEIERRIRAKIPGPDTGIEIKRTMCNICSPNYHCGICAYIKDGAVIKIEGDRENTISKGHICTKGAANRDYIYRKDRILAPLRRVGSRGEGRFEPISWDEAYDEIAHNLLRVREIYGPESVVCFGGYSKWYLPFFHRFAYDFGTPNVIGDGSTCQTNTFLAWKTTTGTLGSPDIAHAKTYFGWGLNGYYSITPALREIQERRKAGMKIVIVDPRTTPATEHLADLHLRIRPGTDGALALGMGNLMIQRDWIDHAYIDNYVLGFEEYAEYVSQFPMRRIVELTGLKEKEIMAAAELYALHGPTAMHESAAPLAHHKNAFQTYRAMIALQAITGNYDRIGGTIPAHYCFNNNKSNFSTAEEEFVSAPMPQHYRTKIGTDRFPLWHNDLNLEAQGVELPSWLEGKREYPVKAIFGLGMNYRMLPESDHLIQSMVKNLDFFVNGDLFLTDTCKYADLVLPICSSFERANFFAGNGQVFYTEPVISPLGESKSDIDVIRDMARRLDLSDDLLKDGYDACLDAILKPTGVTVAQLKAAKRPLPVQNLEPFVERAFSRQGFRTPSGKFELRSLTIEQYRGEKSLSAIPTWIDPLEGQDQETYPLVLSVGNRYPYALHSRLHDVPSLRFMQKEPRLDISPEDAAAYGIAEGDLVRVYNSCGQVYLKAALTSHLPPGYLNMLQGYREADGNTLVPIHACDEYTGFPSFRTVCCGIEKAAEGRRAQ